MTTLSYTELEHAPEEVGHDHMRTKSGRVAPYITLYKCKSRSKALKTVLKVEIHEKRRSSAIPSLILHANRENSFLRMATPKTVFVDSSQLLSPL